MVRLLVIGSLLFSAYAQQVSLEISNPTLAGTSCNNDAECPGGSHVRCTAESNLWGGGDPLNKQCIAQSYETTNNGASYTSKDATIMLTQLADDGSKSTCDPNAAQSRDSDRCVTYKVWLQSSSAAIDSCTVEPADANEKIQMSFKDASTGTLVQGTDFNGQKRYSCEFSPRNNLYIGDAEVKVDFKAGATVVSSLNLKLLVKPGADPLPANGNLLEMYANGESGDSKKGISNADVTADKRGNQFSYDLNLRDKRYLVKDDSGRRLLADRHAVSLATAEIEVLDDMQVFGPPNDWDLVAKYDDDTEAFIVMGSNPACGGALEFSEASQAGHGPDCPASGYEDYVLYSLKGAFAFKVDLPSFRKAYLKANCNSELCPPKLTFDVPTLSTVVRDLVLPTLEDDTSFSISVDLIEPELKNQRTTIKENEPLEKFYRLKKKPTVMSNLLNNANKDPIDLDDLQFNGNPVAACNAASMKVYEILAQSDKNKADKLYKNADDALKSADCKAPAINLGNQDTLRWAADDGTVTFNLATKSFIGDDGAVVTFDGIEVSHDRLSVIRATSVELDGSLTRFLNVKSDGSADYVFTSAEGSVVDANGDEINPLVAFTLSPTGSPREIHTAGCNGHVDIQLKRDGYAALQYNLRVPCERSTGKSVIDLTLKAQFTSEYNLLNNAWGSSASYDSSADNPVAAFGTCNAPAADGIDTKTDKAGCAQQLTDTGNTGTFSNTMTISQMKTCAMVYQENYAPNENGKGDYRFETTIAMVQGTAGSVFRHCSDRNFVTVINRDATASTTSVSIAEDAQEAVLERTANVKNIEWVKCQNGDSLFKQRIDISVEHEVNGDEVAYDLTSIESKSNSDNLELSIVTDNGVEIVRMESTCVQVTYTECENMNDVNTPYGALAETSTEFILSGTYTGDDGGNEHQTRITVGTNYQSCPVDGQENAIDELSLRATINCDGTSSPCAENAAIEPNVPINTAVVVIDSQGANYDGSVWQPETLDIKLVRKSLGGVVLSTDHVCDCDHDKPGPSKCYAQNNNYGFYLFECAMSNTGATFDFDSNSLSGYYGDSSFEVHFEMVLYGGSAGRRLRTVKKMKASPGLEAEVDNIRVLPATMAAKLDSEPSNHTNHTAPKESPTEAPKEDTDEDTHCFTTFELVMIILGSIAGGGVIVVFLSLAGCCNCNGDGSRSSSGSGGRGGTTYRQVGRAVRFKEINY